MRGVLISVALAACAVSAWWIFSPKDNIETKTLNETSRDPSSPQAVGEPPQEINIEDPAPSIYVTSRPTHDLARSQRERKERTRTRKMVPTPIDTDGEINPKALKYYQKKGYLGADKTALAVFKSQTEVWTEKTGSDGLSFDQVGGGVTLTFETNAKGQINGAIVNLSGGGAGAHLMTTEMWMSGLDQSWELQWETQRPGPVAGTIPTHDDQEIHYYCDMVSMDESGALNEPSRCHFRLNEPTAELHTYLQQADAPPIQRAKSRLD